MIYLITGNSKKVFSKTEQLVNSMLAKRPESGAFKLNSNNWDSNKLEELISGQSLFTKKYIVQFSRILENPEAKNYLLGKLRELKESENIFVWAEPKMDVKTFKKFEKYVEKAQEFKESRSVSKRDTEVFAISDAFGERKHKKLWLLYTKLIKKVGPEEIYGILWWQLKSMLLVSKSSGIKETGLKPFVYLKSKRFLNNYSEEELSDLSNKLMDLYHESRQGGAELEIKLEQFILGI